MPLKLDYNFIKAVLNISPLYYGIVDLKKECWVFRSSIKNEVDQLTGRTEEKLRLSLKEEIQDLIHEDDKPYALNNLAQLKEASSDSTNELVMRLKATTGDFIWVRSISRVFQWDENDKPYLGIMVVENINERINIENKIKELVLELEEISYRNSHEVRAPVASILGLTDLLLKESDISQEALKVVECLSKSVHHLDTIIKEINDLSAR